MTAYQSFPGLRTTLTIHRQEDDNMATTTYSAGEGYRDAMGRLLVMYTQIDRLIMEACAERIDSAPDEAAKLALAKQVGDESRHVSIQRKWMEQFGTDTTPVISPQQEALLRNHFRKLSWLDFLADMYICVEALGSEAVEKIVPLADPGTQESLKIPLQDELDHIAFGVSRLKQELAALSVQQRETFLESLPNRIDRITRSFHGFGLDLPKMFESVGANYNFLRQSVLARRRELLQELAEPIAA
jgi:hypothetical protein